MGCTGAPAARRLATQSDAIRRIAIADRTPNNPDLPFQRLETVPNGMAEYIR
jgi:hypothetical protein